jgi:DNA-binding transcriptional MocR family regulator
VYLCGGAFCFWMVAVMARTQAWFCMVPSRVVFDPWLSDGACRLYSALLVWQEDGRFPSELEMAADLKRSASTIKRSMAELVGAGLVSRQRRGHGEKRGADASTFDAPDIHRPPVARKSGIHGPNMASPVHRPNVASPKALKAEKSETADGERVRAVESADSEGNDSERASDSALAHDEGLRASPTPPKPCSSASTS